MSDEELDALYEEYRRLPPSPYRDYLVRSAKRQGRKEGRQEGRQEGEQKGEQKGEQRTLLAIASRLMSPVEVERLSTLTLDALRELVERELASLTSNRSSDGAR